MGELASLLPAGGLGAISTGGLLLAVVAYLLNANRLDRKEYQEAIDRAEKRADAAEARTDAAERRTEEVERRTEVLQRAIDDARTARRAAEDRLAVVERMLRDRGGEP